MITTFIVAFLAIFALLIIHEFGHFIIAKKCGVKVEEFGVGYPPRLFGKKIGETLYSVNLIPFGAFVKVKGEIEEGEGGDLEDYRSFANHPMWQRMLIVLGGVLSFWIVAIILLSLVSGVWGMPTAVSDTETGLTNPKVQIIGIAKDSPAEQSELEVADIILGIKVPDKGFEEVDKLGQVQEIINSYKGEEVVLKIKRGNEVKEFSIVPRIDSPEKEGPMGVGLARIALKKSPWYKAPFEGARLTGIMTLSVLDGWVMAIKDLAGVEELPSGVNLEMRGPLGIFTLLTEYFEMGINYFFYLISLISVALALANILPIPALDGGKIVFLGIESIRGKPVSPQLEQKISTFFFMVLILLLAYVTIRFDIPRFL
jgi:regulator of sigma E protease